MLIDDFSTGRKPTKKLNVQPPPRRQLKLEGPLKTADTTLAEAPQNASRNQMSATTQPPPAAAQAAPLRPSTPEKTSSDTAQTSAPQETSKTSLFKKITQLRITKKHAVIGGLVALVLVGAGTFFLRSFKKPPPPIQTSAPPAEPQKAAEPPKPLTEASRLSGVQIAPELNQRPVTAILIENSPDARPQSGLLEAGVVFEAIAEGGITRFAALYQEGRPGYIGPVRSLRPYYLDFIMPFDPAIAHVGGSLDALQQVRSQGIKDLDQFQNGGSYTRIKERFAPHNVYTSSDNLDALMKSKGYTSSTFSGWPRKDDTPSSTPNATSIDFNISGYYYNPHFEYDAATNSYKRSQASEPHVDEKSKQQLSPRVVIAIISPYRNVQSSDGWRTDYQTVGEGAIVVFQDGVATSGTWKKAGRTNQYEFLDAEGQPIKLNRGQTWVSMVSAANMISYK